MTIRWVQKLQWLLFEFNLASFRSVELLTLGGSVSYFSCENELDIWHNCTSPYNVSFDCFCQPFSPCVWTWHLSSCLSIFPLSNLHHCLVISSSSARLSIFWEYRTRKGQTWWWYLFGKGNNIEWRLFPVMLGQGKGKLKASETGRQADRVRHCLVVQVKGMQRRHCLRGEDCGRAACCTVVTFTVYHAKSFKNKGQGGTTQQQIVKYTRAAECSRITETWKKIMV